MSLTAILVDDGFPRLSRRKHIVTAERDRIIHQRPSNGHSAPTHPKKGYLADPEHIRRSEAYIGSEIERGVAEYFAEHGGNGNKLCQLLDREAPGLLDTNPLRLVFQLVRQYGLQTVIEGYQASQLTGFPFVAEVVAASNEALGINDSIDTTTIDPEIKDIFDEQQAIVSRDVRVVLNKPRKYRDEVTASAHFYASG